MAFNLKSSSLSTSEGASGSDPSVEDDPSAMSNDWKSISLVGMGCLGLLCCLWYSLETHVVVTKRHRFRFEQHEDCFFVMLCFAYADVWNVFTKCRLFFVTKSSETDDTRVAVERQLAG